MAQTSVSTNPPVTYEGKVHAGVNFPTSIVSRIADGLVYFGKGVALSAATEVTVGQQKVKLPTSAGMVAYFEGVAIADTTLETPSGQAYGGYVDKSAVPVMRKGLVWVVLPDAITDLNQGVYIRHANGAAVALGSLGSFRASADADYTQISTGVKWAGYTVVGSTKYGLLELNLVA